MSELDEILQEAEEQKQETAEALKKSKQVKQELNGVSKTRRH